MARTWLISPAWYAAWVAMAHVGFRGRPVAALANETRFRSTVAPGEGGHPQDSSSDPLLNPAADAMNKGAAAPAHNAATLPKARILLAPNTLTSCFEPPQGNAAERTLT